MTTADTNDFSGLSTDAATDLVAADRLAWESYGLSPAESHPWQIYGINDPVVAAGFAREGIAPAEAAEWVPLDLSPAEAREIRATGLSAADVARTRASLNPADPTLSAQEVALVEISNPGLGSDRRFSVVSYAS